MDSDSHSDVAASRWRFSLRTLFIVLVMTALTLSLLKLGGARALGSTLVIGLVIGGAISLLGSNKAGITPFVSSCASTSGALTAEILGVYVTGFNVEDVGRIPQTEVRDLFWIALCGALLGATSGTVGRWLLLNP